MKLVLDTVPNHIGPTHPWVRDEPAPDWFHGTLAHHREAETNFSALIDPHAAERDRIGTLDGWFANVLPDMDTESPAVAQYLRQNAVWWIEETGADALRIDTFPYVNREFWHDFNGELKQLYPRLTEVGEVFNGDPDIVSAYADGVTRAGVDTRLFTPFDFPTYFALRDVFAPKVGSKPAPMSKLAEILVADNLYPHPERLVPFLGNHDTTRILTETKSEAAVRLGFAYLLTTRGMPQIYSGDEIAMYGGGDPDDRHDFPGGFITTPTAFSANGRTAVQQRMFAWVSQLTSVRQKHVALGCGGEQVLSANADWLVTLRDGAHAAAGTCAASAERVLVAIHRGMGDTDSMYALLDVNLADTWASGCHLKLPDLATPASTASIAEDTLHLKASGNAVVIAACR
jgi:glycosidase